MQNYIPKMDNISPLFAELASIQLTEPISGSELLLQLGFPIPYMEQRAPHIPTLQFATRFPVGIAKIALGFL